MKTLAAAILALLAPAAARAHGRCGAFDTRYDTVRLIATPCPEDMPVLEPGMPPMPYGTYWRKRAKNVGDAREYVSALYVRERDGRTLPERVAADQPYKLAVLRVFGNGDGHQVNPTAADYLERALSEEKLGRSGWPRLYAENGLTLEPDNARLKAVAARHREEGLHGGMAFQGALETYANAHRMLERGGGKEEALRWLDRAITLHPTLDAYRLRSSLRLKLGRPDLALADAEAGLALAPKDVLLADAREEAAKAMGKTAAAPPPAAAPEPKPAMTATPDNLGRPIAQAEPPAVSPKDDAVVPEPSRDDRGKGSTASFHYFILAVLAVGMGLGTAIQRRMSAPAAPQEAASADASTADGTATVRDAPRQKPKPRALSRYDLMTQIGSGGMGLVFEGVRKVQGDRGADRVAIKQMRPEIKDDPEARDGFKREAEILARLKHPNIVSFHELFEEDGELFLVFDYVDGKTLAQLLREKGRLSVPETQGIFTAVCSAISAAHAQHVLHRDLKPSNIMIDSRGGVKVMDFGIARAAKDTISRLTNVDAAGTPAYMAPEQHLGRGAKPSDIFSLGVCLYETLTGTRPFPGPDYLVQKERMLFTPPQFIVPRLPKTSELLFQITLAADPAKRVADAQELIESIARLS